MSYEGDMLWRFVDIPDPLTMNDGLPPLEEVQAFLKQQRRPPHGKLPVQLVRISQGEVLHRFICFTDASNALHRPSHHISQECRGQAEPTGDFSWCFYEGLYDPENWNNGLPSIETILEAVSVCMCGHTRRCIRLLPLSILSLTPLLLSSTH